MTDTIVCPNCNSVIAVIETLSAQLRTQLQKEIQAEIRKKEEAVAERETQVC